MNKRIKTAVAGIFQRFPILGSVGQRIYRLRQARFTIGAVGVVFNDEGQILLLEHVFHPVYPWGLPGGWVDRREPPAAAVERELSEETGLQVEVIMPLDVDLGDYHDHLDMVYLCRLIGGTVQLSGEILDYGWYTPDELPAMFTIQRRAIEQAVRLREAMAWASAG
jgi:8-oxo-dGTP diphosphatase